PFFPDLNHRPVEELMRWFAEPAHGMEVPEEERAFWLEEVAIGIAKSGKEGIDFLLSCLPSAEDLKLRAILVGLSFAGKKLSSRRRAEICMYPRHLLGDSRPVVVAEAVDTLRHLGCQD